MLDKESEIYNSGLLNRGAQVEFGAIAVTKDGLEVSAAVGGLRFEYSGTWEQMRDALSRADARLKVPQRKLLEEPGDEGGSVAFAQKVPKRCESPHGRN